MGKMNKSKCVYNYSQPIDTDVDAIATHWEGKAKVNATTESNNTLTIEVCFKKQSKPPRKFKNGTYTEKEDMEDASKEHWDEYQKENGDGPPSKDSSYYVDDAGVHTVGKQRGPKREKDSDGWDGKTYDENKSDWGKSYEDEQYQSNDTYSESESGYGKPSKGSYSSDMGGYKSFGTEGQGDSPSGAKDTNDTTCGDRVVLLSVRALNDTSDTAASSTSSSGGVHPVVKSTTSHMTFEVGSYSFYDDLEIYGSAAESASVLKTSWMLLSIASLFVLSFTSM